MLCLASLSFAASSTLKQKKQKKLTQNLETTPQSHGAPFDWLAHWYPVALESATPKDRPTAVKLLGRELVLWHDGSNWRCFEDRCPHRAVPLSEGRVETAAAAAVAADGAAAGKARTTKKKKSDANSLPKELQCAYHGFQFAFDGACTAVPQALSARAEQRAKASPRACAAVHPVRHCGDGLLWAWPVAGDFVRAGATPTGEHSLLDRAFPAAADAAISSADGGGGGGGRKKKSESDVVFLSPWFVRDVPFDVDVLAENVVDPSHVFFSHHGALGSRYAPPMQQMIPPPPLPRGMRPDPAADPVAEAEEAGGFAVQQLLHGPRRPAGGGLPADPPPDAEIPSSKRDRFDKRHGTILWKPPTQARYDFSHGAHMIVHGTPLARGKTRLFFAVYRRRDATPALLRLVLGALSSPPLRFLAHHGNNNVLDGDNVFIAAQGATLRALEARGKSFQDVYFMPTSMDAAVARVRGWFARHGFGAEARNGGIPWRGEEGAGEGARRQQPAPPTRYEALQRWESHTKHCPDCLRAFRAFSVLRDAAAGLCGAALAWAIGSAAAAVASASATSAAASSAAAAAAASSSFRSRALSAAAAAPAVAPSLAVAGAAAVAFFLLRREVQKFVYVDYVHADHD